MNELIILEDVNKYYQNQSGIALGINKVNLKFSIGEFVAITGKSGSGKTTLLNIIACLDKIDSGKYFFNNHEIGSFDIEELEEFRKQNVSFIFQEYNLVESFSVLDNIMVPLLYKGLSIKEARSKALELVKKVGLEKVYKNKVTTLSGGEQQRTVIARALAKDSPIIACDEPTGNLDKETGKQIIKLLHELASDKLILFVTHSPEELDGFKTREIVISDGRIIKDEAIIKTDPKDYVQKPASKAKNIFYQIAKYFFSQPRKGFLIFLTYFVFGFFIIMLMALLSNNIFKELNNMTNTRYHLSDPKLYEVYKKGAQLSSDDITKINNNTKLKPIKNIGYLYSNSTINLKKRGEQFYRDNNFNIIPEDVYINYRISKGRLPKAKNEALLILGRYRKSEYQIGDIIYYIDPFDTKKEIEFQVVGIISQTTLDIKTSSSFNIGLTNEFLDSPEAATFFYDEFKSTFTLKANDKTSNFFLSYISAFNTDIIIDDTLGNRVEYYGSSDYLFNDALEFKGELIHKQKSLEKTVNVDIKLIKVDKNDPNVDILKMSSKKMAELFKQYDNNLFYYSNLSEQNLLKLVNNNEATNEYSVISTAKTTKLVEELDLAQMILTTISVILIVIATLVFSLIMNLFIKQIFKIKQKDYTIFRTLGANKKDINKFIIFENLLITHIAYLVFLVIIIFLKFNFRQVEFLNVFHNFKLPFLVLFYFLLVYISLSTSIKYLSSLYKKQISTTLSKGGSKR